ncbi:MAG TPA: hypothetical protein VFB53_09525 [Burkholderiales bacterium]|nr:hypothetical protein [Burkholderiales bacterium]
MSAFVPDSSVPADGAEAQAAAEAEAPEERGSAAERLAASRERMRQWMMQTDRRGASRERMEAAMAAGEQPALADRLRHAPVIGVLIDALGAWWADHPLQPAVVIAQGVVNRRITPVVRRHPVPILLGAFLVGVLLVRLRPWRWIAKPALFAGLGSQLVSRVVSAVPMDKVLAALGALAGFQAASGGEPKLTDPDLSAQAAAAAAAAPPGTAPSTGGATPSGGAAPGASSPPVPRAAVEAETVTP